MEKSKEEIEADELIDKYYNDENLFTESGITYRQACKYASICVDEILKAVTTIADKKYEFWQKVKQILIDKERNI